MQDMRVIVLLALFLSAALAFNSQCIEDFQKGATCVANDVRIAKMTLIGQAVQCVQGQYLTVSMRGYVETTATTRYDIGFFLGLAGGDGRSGQCWHDFLAYAAGSNCGTICQDPNTAPCSPNCGSTIDLASGQGPYYNGETSTPNDICGDTQQTSSTVEGALNGPVIKLFPVILVLCTDSDSNGEVDLQTCTSWEQTAGDDCSSVDGAGPGTKSKCRCGSTNIENLRVCSFEAAPCVGDQCIDKFYGRAEIYGALGDPIAGQGTLLYALFYVDWEIQSVAFEFIDPSQDKWGGGSPSVRRTDLLDPCRLRRVSVCDTSCTQLPTDGQTPRLFEDATDTCITLADPTTEQLPGEPLDAACNRKCTKVGSEPGDVKTLWGKVVGGDTIPCAAELNDGVVFRLYDVSGAQGVTVGQPKSLSVAPINTVNFDFVAIDCNAPFECKEAVDVLFVVDEQYQCSGCAAGTEVGLTDTEYGYVKEFITESVDMFTASNGNKFFAAHFTNANGAGTRGSLGVPGSACVTWTNNNANFKNIVTTHTKQGGLSNIYQTVMDAMHLWWSGSITAPGTPVAQQCCDNALSYNCAGICALGPQTRMSLVRRMIVIVSGPDSSGATTAQWDAYRALRDSLSVQAWAYGIGANSACSAGDPGGACQTALLNNIAGGITIGGSPILPSDNVVTLQSSVILTWDAMYFVPKVCPANEFLCTGCNGFCCCVGTCCCPDCDTSNVCSPGVCDDANPAKGCVVRDINFECQTGEDCYTDTCEDIGGVATCVHTPIVCDDADACTTDYCKFFECNYDRRDSECNDGNICTKDLCTGSDGKGGVTCSNNNDCEFAPASCKLNPCTDWKELGQTEPPCNSKMDGCNNVVCEVDTSKLNCPTTGKMYYDHKCIVTPLSALEACGSPGEQQSQCFDYVCTPNIPPLAQPCSTDTSKGDNCIAKTDQCTKWTCDHTLGCQSTDTSSSCPGFCPGPSCDLCFPGGCDKGTGKCTTSSVTCEDNNGCTKNVCTDGVCSYPPKSVCLTDGNDCTTDACQSTGDDTYTCVYTPICLDTVDDCRPDPCLTSPGPCDTLKTECNTVECKRSDKFDCPNYKFDYDCIVTPLGIDEVCSAYDRGGFLNKCYTYTCDDAKGCDATPVDCTKSDLCKDWSCDPDQGCVYTPHRCDKECPSAPGKIPCDLCDPGRCDDAKGCVTDPVICNDGKACTVNDRCVGGVCIYDPKNCDDGNKCTDDSCVTGTGDCLNEWNPLNDYPNCLITSPCVNASVICNDNDPCTKDVCITIDPESINPGYECTYTPLSAAEVTQLCGVTTACVAYECVDNGFPFNDNRNCKETETKCDDKSDCTTDSCDDTTGCVYEPITCDDKDLCTTDTCLTTGGCQYTPITCDDKSLCTTDTCDKTSGCVYTPLPCIGVLPCGNNICLEGTGKCQLQYDCAKCPPSPPCQTPGLCNDKEGCTKDTCTNGPAPTDIIPGGDAKSCAALWGHTCTYTPIVDPTCQTDACTTRYCEEVDDNTPGCKEIPTVCDDKNGCTKDTCVLPGGCVYEDLSHLCDDNNKCTTDWCDTTGTLILTPVLAPPCKHDDISSTCDDKKACTKDSCSKTDGCVYDPIVYSDDKCGKVKCVEPTGNPQVQYDCSLCPPANPCPQGDLTCNDKLGCTKDTCILGPAPTGIFPGGSVADCPWTSECKHTNITAGVIEGCVDRPCYSVFCQPVGENGYVCGKNFVVCNDNNGCTRDTCDPEIGCVYTPRNCTSQQTDACFPLECVPDKVQPGNYSLSKCLSVNPITCDDGLVCTTDRCDPAIWEGSPCVYENVICAAAGACDVIVGCFEDQNPPCVTAVLSILLDFCGVCKGNNNDCFFQQASTFGTAEAVAVAVVVPTVIAGVIALLLGIFAGKKGYDYYKAQSEKTASSLSNNPYYKSNANAGEMPDVGPPQ